VYYISQPPTGTQCLCITYGLAKLKPFMKVAVDHKLATQTVVNTEH